MFFSATSDEIQKRVPNRREISSEILCSSIPFFPNSPNKTMEAKMPKVAVTTPIRDGAPTRKEVSQRSQNHSFDVSEVKKFTPQLPTKRATDNQVAIWFSCREAQGTKFGDKAKWGKRRWMIPRVGPRFHATFQRKAWTSEGDREKQIVLWEKSGDGGEEDKAEKEETEKVLDGEGVQNLEFKCDVIIWKELITAKRSVIDFWISKVPTEAQIPTWVGGNEGGDKTIYKIGYVVQMRKTEMKGDWVRLRIKPEPNQIATT